LMALAAYSLNYPLYLMDADPFKALQKHKAVRQFAVLAKPKTVDAKAGYRRSRQGKPRIRATNRLAYSTWGYIGTPPLPSARLPLKVAP
jgi:hypothetical protein